MWETGGGRKEELSFPVFKHPSTLIYVGGGPVRAVSFSLLLWAYSRRSGLQHCYYYYSRQRYKGCHFCSVIDRRLSKSYAGGSG